MSTGRLRLIGALGLIGVMMTTAACGEGGAAPFYRIRVDVEGNGPGSGTVEVSDESVGLTCTITAGSESTGCDDTFDDAGGGGTFTLTAIPSGGSVFTAWSGCTSVAGPVCTLTFGTADTTLAPIVTFTLGEGNTVTLYNGAAVSAYLLAPGETAGAGNLLTPNATREVVVPSAIGTEILFRAVVGTSQVAQITCTVTAAAWAGAGQPLVDLFGGDGYLMHCNNF
jgi:hypothetical protein